MDIIGKGHVKIYKVHMDWNVAIMTQGRMPASTTSTMNNIGPCR
jgi:hypothetical protein